MKWLAWVFAGRGRLVYDFLAVQIDFDAVQADILAAKSDVEPISGQLKLT